MDTKFFKMIDKSLVMGESGIKKVGIYIADFIVNKAGGKIYLNDPSKHELLETDGKAYDVLSVGLLQDNTPIATIKKDGKARVYRLPSELFDWVFTTVGMSQMGMNPFPVQVEFGIIEGRHYAEIL
jgi:hypothetical protein